MSLSNNQFFYVNSNYTDTSNVLSNYMNLTHNTNNTLNIQENPLSKYARGLFFSPNYNKQFFDVLNWANNLGIYKNQTLILNPLINNVLMNQALGGSSSIVFSGGIFETGAFNNYYTVTTQSFNPFTYSTIPVSAIDKSMLKSKLHLTYDGPINNSQVIDYTGWNGFSANNDWSFYLTIQFPSSTPSNNKYFYRNSSDDLGNGVYSQVELYIGPENKINMYWIRNGKILRKEIESSVVSTFYNKSVDFAITYDSSYYNNGVTTAPDLINFKIYYKVENSDWTIYTSTNYYHIQ